MSEYKRILLDRVVGDGMTWGEALEEAMFVELSIGPRDGDIARMGDAMAEAVTAHLLPAVGRELQRIGAAISDGRVGDVLRESRRGRGLWVQPYPDPKRGGKCHHGQRGRPQRDGGQLPSFQPVVEEKTDDD